MRPSRANSQTRGSACLANAGIADGPSFPYLENSSNCVFYPVCCRSGLDSDVHGTLPDRNFPFDRIFGLKHVLHAKLFKLKFDGAAAKFERELRFFGKSKVPRFHGRIYCRRVVGKAVRRKSRRFRLVWFLGIVLDQICNIGRQFLKSRRDLISAMTLHSVISHRKF